MILKLKPAFKDYIWGGAKLRDDFGFKSDLKKIAENPEFDQCKDCA